MGRRYESIYVICTDGIAIQCPHPAFPFPETEINNAFIIGRSCQAAERAQRMRAGIGVGNRLSLYLPYPPWNDMDHKWRRNHLRMVTCIIKHTPNSKSVWVYVQWYPHDPSNCGSGYWRSTSWVVSTIQWKDFFFFKSNLKPPKQVLAQLYKPWLLTMASVFILWTNECALTHPGAICKSQIALGDTNDSFVNLKGDLWQDYLLTSKILKKGPFTLPLSPNAKIAQLKTLTWNHGSRCES